MTESVPSTKPRLWLAAGTCSLAPHVLCYEAGIEFDTLVIDIMQGGFPAKHAAINPKKRIPILELDGQVITETTAVMTAISQLAPDKQLFGKTPMDAVRVYEWFNWLSGTVHERGFGSYFTTTWYYDGPDEDGRIHKAIQAKSSDWIKHCFGIIEERLGGEEHAVNGVFTAADVFLWVIYRWGYLLKWEMSELYPNWTKLVNKVTQREAVKKAVEVEGIPIIRDNRLDGFPEDESRYARKPDDANA